MLVARVPAPLLRMVDEMSPAAVHELRRALHLTLFPEPSAAERHRAELGSLALLLRRHGKWPPAIASVPAEAKLRTLRYRNGALTPRDRWPTITRPFYDQHRAAAAPSSETLLRRHCTRSWSLICRMASALPVNGERLVDGATWPSAFRGRPGTRSRAPYTREEIIDAVRRAAEALNRPVDQLTVATYAGWTDAQRRRARGLGLPDPRLPHVETMRRGHFPRGWRAVIRAAARCSTR